MAIISQEACLRMEEAGWNKRATEADDKHTGLFLLSLLLLVLLPIKPMTLNMLDIALALIRIPTPQLYGMKKEYWLCRKYCSGAKYSHHNLVVPLWSSGKDWPRVTLLNHFLRSHILFHVFPGPLLQLLYLC